MSPHTRLDPRLIAVADGPTCAVCGTVSGTERDTLPWCSVCGIYLVCDGPTGEWVSFADELARCRARAAAVRAEYARNAAAAVECAVRAMVPPGWQMSNIGGGFEVRPPTGPVDVAAFIGAPDRDGRWWGVGLVNRTRGISFPIYEGGGVRAARFATGLLAVSAAVSHLRMESGTTATPELRLARPS